MIKFERQEREFIRCTDCPGRAILRIVDGIKHTLDGKKHKEIPLCLEHYDLRHENIAQKWNHDNGLDTVEKRKEYVKIYLGKFLKKLPARAG